jgi:catechol 2,3-dioxygenase-like lactoylglutathione lyase family enzyme
MTNVKLNHVSIHAEDIQESAEFYHDLFDMERVPAPNFDVEVYWLRCGDKQIHLFNRDVPAPQFHHIGLQVDDFEEVFYRAEEMGIFDDWAQDKNPPGIYGLPDGGVQMYIRDPSGNMVEIDWPDASSLDEEIREQIVDRSELVSQDDVADDATLFFDRQFWYSD